MIGTGLAILGAGLLGAGASMWGANKAADAQKEAAAQAAALQQKQMQINQDNAAPWIAGGKGATNLLQSFYGLGGDPALGQNALKQFYNSPDYQFALKGGSDALDNSLASKGGVLGGNAIKAQTEYGSGLATQNLQNYLKNIFGISQQGLQAGGNVAGVNTVGANNAAQSIMAGGTADAAGTLGTVKGIYGGLNALQQYNQMTQSSYKPGGGTGFSLTGTGGLY